MSKTVVENNSKVLDNASELIYSLSNRVLKSETFTYLAEVINSFDEENSYGIDMQEKVNNIKLNIQINSAEEALRPLIKLIMDDNQLSIKEKHTYIFFSFVAVESLSLAINYAIFDEIADNEEIAELLFAGYYNGDYDGGLDNFVGEDNMSLQEAMTYAYDRYMIKYDIRALDTRLNGKGSVGDFVGWANINLISSLYNLNVETSEVYSLLAKSDYYTFNIEDA